MLTVKQIEAAKPREKSYRLADSAGLFLFVPPTGKKVWRMRYRFDGKEKTLVIGPYPEISLTEARAKQSEAKMKLLSGLDPAEQKQAVKKKEKMVDSFGEVYAEWFAHKRSVWSERYGDEIGRMFHDDILPEIGHMKMEEVEPMVLLRVVRKFEERGAMERANKARRRCGEVFRYAIVTGRAKYNPAPDLADAMKGYRKKHFPFLTPDQIPAFNRALAGFPGSQVAKAATMVLQYTALRTKELRSMQWVNVDFETRLITIDESVMKNRKIHVVPMSDQVIAILKMLKSITGMSPFVFAGRNSKDVSISENTVLGVIRYIGYDGLASGHGFRHQFSTVMNEQQQWPNDAIEKQLAHTDKNNVRGIYNHAQYLDIRREMMQWWADYLDAGMS